MDRTRRLVPKITSGFDVCNGVFYDSIGNYAYFATQTYPYLIGCFGSGNYPSILPTCTTNPPSLYTMSSFVSSNASTTTVLTTSVVPTTTVVSTSSLKSRSNENGLINMNHIHIMSLISIVGIYFT